MWRRSKSSWSRRIAKTSSAAHPPTTKGSRQPHSHMASAPMADRTIAATPLANTDPTPVA